MIDLVPLWNFSQPQLSEERFRSALADASPDDALILKTQIARTYGLRRDFPRARALLEEIAPELLAASAEAQARHALELGRTYASAAHPEAPEMAEARELAGRHYRRALQIAREGQLDGLAIDALHMLAFVDTAPVDQLKWGREALAVSLASTQPAAMRWQASIRNNIGYALHQLGRFDEALAEFEKALVLRQEGQDPEAIAIAHWMIAWTLRSLERIPEALDIQLRLASEFEALGTPDRHVFEELEALYRALGEAGLAAQYRARREALPK